MSAHNLLYDTFEQAMVGARQARKLTQSDLADRLGKPQSYVSKYESGERRLDVVEFLEICDAIPTDPHAVLLNVKTKQNAEARTIFHDWGVTPAQITELVRSNPSLRGMVLGYVAEHKAQEFLKSIPEIEDLGKNDDHDRLRKGDRNLRYRTRNYKMEVKSLQTKTAKVLGDGTWTGKFQCDGSDRRILKFEDGSELNTTLLLRGEFDVLAVNCFAFGNTWKFAFAKNSDLPTSNHAGYTEAQRVNLIASLISITWPPKSPFRESLVEVLDELRAESPKVNIDTLDEVITTEQKVIRVKQRKP